MGPFVCEFCDESMYGETQHACKPEHLRARLRHLETERLRQEASARAMRDAVLHMLGEVSWDSHGDKTEVPTEWLRRLYRAAGGHLEGPEAADADAFWVCWNAATFVVSGAVALFRRNGRGHRPETLLTRLQALHTRTARAREALGWGRSKCPADHMDVTPEDIVEGRG